MRARVAISGENLQFDLTLEEGQKLVCGRAAEADLRIPDERVSRRHFSLGLIEHGLQLADLRSGHGTYVNGKLVEKAILRSGDQVQVADTTLVVSSVKIEGADLRNDPTLACGRCGHPISLTTLAEGDVLEVRRNFRCPSCRTIEAAGSLHLKEREAEVVARLRGEGFDAIEPLASSSSGWVFRAFKPGLDRWVAVKVVAVGPTLSPEKVKRLLVEGQTESGLDHANIVKVFSVAQSEDSVTIVMELIDGPTLLEEIERMGSLDPCDVLGFAEQIASGLAHAHAKSIVHRNVTPSNVMISADVVPKLIDFGLAKKLTEMTRVGITGEGATLGSVGYMAPEQVQRARDVDARADIYGLGATLYHALSGRPPFLAVKEIIRRGTPPPLESICDAPVSVVELVSKMMDPEPSKRFPSAAAALAAITGVFDQLANRTAKFKPLPRDLSGPISGSNMNRFLLMLERKQKLDESGTLSIETPEGTGRIKVWGGRIVGVDPPPASGEGRAVAEVVRRLLRAQEGSFHYVAIPRGSEAARSAPSPCRLAIGPELHLAGIAAR